MGTTVERKSWIQASPVQFLANDVICYRILMVNVCMIGQRHETHTEWVLVDTGLKRSEKRIQTLVEKVCGEGITPKAIILTHGHFDHIGAVIPLAKAWNVPVYAHPLEFPYVTGQEDYLPPDPSVGGGLMARLSMLYPKEAIQLGDKVQMLPTDGSVPFLPEWRWIHTPGHTPGHVSLFRERDRVLIAGDAITTVKQESALAVLTQYPKLHGPPAYFTTDWQAAKASVQRLQKLRPSSLITGHGQPLVGNQLTQQLMELADRFEELAVPRSGRYVQ